MLQRTFFGRPKAYPEIQSSFTHASKGGAYCILARTSFSDVLFVGYGLLGSKVNNRLLARAYFSVIPFTDRGPSKSKAAQHGAVSPGLRGGGSQLGG